MHADKDIKEIIRRKALDLGFDACGFAAAAPVAQQAIDQYCNWLEEGKNDCMEYASNYKDLRFDPTALVPGAKTVICVALNYYTERRQPKDAPQFSIYAYGKDYHDAVRNRLMQLATFIKETWHAESRVCVDTAPVMEKYWARTAGVGMIGRNNLLIIPGKGSYFFLGELITTLELPPDNPCTDTCGNCNKCLQACPGGALEGDSLDARRCLSCQLIERRGELPAWVQEKAGIRIYGCDECQLCCPHNRNAISTHIEEFNPTEDFMNLTLDSVLGMDTATFNTIFRNTAVKRLKLDRLMRNARNIAKKY